MNLRHLFLAALCGLALSACSNTEPGTVGLGGQCLYTADCAKPFLCYDGSCQLGPSAVCSADTRRCNGGVVEACSSLGDRWETIEACDSGCFDGACRPPVCTPGERKCDGTYISECLPNGSGFATLQACPTACTTSAEGVECSTPICTPFETRCGGDSNALETCNARGTAWNTERCSENAGEAVCVAGRCMAAVCSVTKNSGGQVTSREQRCRGAIAEECNDSGTGWSAREICDGGCDLVEGRAECADVICSPFTTRCKSDRVTVQTCNARGTAYVDELCSFGQLEGRCVTVAGGAGACFAKTCSVTRNASGSIIDREERCNGGVREQCNATETGWEALEVCQYGCTLGGQMAQCQPPPCEAGEEICDGQALMRCTPDRSGFGFVQFCTSGCSVDENVTPSAASCDAPVCPPLSRQCGSDPDGSSYVNACRADGSGFDRLENCPNACVGGVCVTPSQSCTPGESRCRGAEVEECVQVSAGVSEWRFVERCFGTCSAGACVEAQACGCADGDDSIACGSPGRTPITLSAALPANTNVPCDDVSTVLLYSNVIKSASGLPVADGTLVTFANSGRASLASTDADPATPGLQRPTLHGRASLVLKAPNGCSGLTPVTVQAVVAGRCAGQGQVNFAPAVATTPPSKKVYLAEDFSSVRTQDPAATTALWDSWQGTLIGVSAVNTGTGADGDLDVPAGAPFDLQARGYAPAWNVQSLGAQQVIVDSVQPNLSPGDEVLVYTQWSNAGYNGTFEFKRVASIGTGTVIFTEPLERRFTDSGLGAVPTNHRVILQRVPNFARVTIPDGAQLTTSALSHTGGTPTGGTGILAFRATGRVNIVGRISTQNKGLPVGTTNPQRTTTPSLTKLLAGNPAASAGSAAIYIHANEISFRDGTGFAPATSVITAEGVDGEGGSVRIAASTLAFGTLETRVKTSAASHLRLDYASLDNPGAPQTAVSPTTPAPGSQNFYSGQAGPFIAQTRVAFEETSIFELRTARVLGVLGGANASNFVIPTVENGGLGSVFPQLTLTASADGGVSNGPISSGEVAFGSSEPFLGKKFWWKAAIRNSDARNVYVRGLAFELNLQ